jgi:hypothetical protein
VQHLRADPIAIRSGGSVMGSSKTGHKSSHCGQQSYEGRQ